jgi:hypothetical protein
MLHKDYGRRGSVDKRMSDRSSRDLRVDRRSQDDSDSGSESFESAINS